jgi:hypothetical protein
MNRWGIAKQQRNGVVHLLRQCVMEAAAIGLVSVRSKKLCLKWRQTRVSSVAIWAYRPPFFGFIMVINFPGQSSCLLQCQSTDLKFGMLYGDFIDIWNYLHQKNR